MIRSFKIENSIGETIELDIRRPEDTGFLVTSVTGLTPPKAAISSSEIALFDGSIITGERIENRNIVLSIVFFDANNDKQTIEQLRHKCYRYFPVKQEVRFYAVNDSGTYWIDGIIESNEINIFSQMEAAQISIICPDPYFTKGESEFTDYISQIVPNLEFPISFEVDGNPTPQGYTKYSGSYIIVPKRTETVIDVDSKAFFGNLIVTKVIGQLKNNASGKGQTLTIKGSPKADNPDYVDETEYIGMWTPYEGVIEQSIIPRAEELYLDVKGELYAHSDIAESRYKIIVEEIPNELTSNGSGKGQTLTILGVGGIHGF